MGEVIVARFDTTLPIPPERIMTAALEADLSEVLLMGWDKDGELYMAASHGDLGGHLILLERAKAVLLEVVNGQT